MLGWANVLPPLAPAASNRGLSGAWGLDRAVVAMYVRGMGEPTTREAAYRLLERQSRHRPTNPSGLIDLDTVDFVVERYAPKARGPSRSHSEVALRLPSMLSEITH